jgi:hypothetical protein
MFNLNKNNMPGLHLVRSYTPEELARKKELEKQWGKEGKILDELFEQYLIKNNLLKDDENEYELLVNFLIDEEETISKLLD